MNFPRLLLAITLYVIIVGTLVLTKPAIMFDAEGRPKPFGTGFHEGYSVFAPSVVFPLLAIVCYIIIAWLRLIIHF